MYAIRQFCLKRGIPDRIRDSFIAYCKSSIGDYFNIQSGETVTGILARLREDEIEEFWKKYVNELYYFLSISHTNGSGGLSDLSDRNGTGTL
jgi:hypothetical protein